MSDIWIVSVVQVGNPSQVIYYISTSKVLEAWCTHLHNYCLSEGKIGTQVSWLIKNIEDGEQFQ
jgi:hypothetical protein